MIMKMSEGEIKNIAEILLEVMRKKGITPEKLSELSGIHINIINNLLKEKFESLPPAPYLHGYLIKICTILELNGERVWHEFLKNEERIKRAGKEDVLPTSKLISKRSRILFVASIFVVIILFFGLISYILSKPNLKVNLSPDLITTSTEKIIITGVLKNGDKLLLNGQVINLNENGEFKEEIILKPGFNTFIFEASKILGKTVKITKQVYYEKPPETPSTTPITNTPITNPPVVDQPVTNTPLEEGQ